MKDKKLEPTDGENPPQDVIPVNYEKLANALRQDMRDASEELLKLREWLVFSNSIFFAPIQKSLIGLTMQHIDDALAALDCTDHIKPEPDDSEVRDA